MFASSARPGNIYGWSPTDNRHDAHPTTIPTPTGHSPSIQSLPLPSSSSTPRAIRNPIPRGLSLDSRLGEYSDDGDADPHDDDDDTFSPYHNPTSLRRYRLKRNNDPFWAPRPPNAFILFRREYVEKHKGESLSEKVTLSKRASDAWKALKGEGQKLWYDLAKVKAAEHLERHPGYVFRPNKQTRSESRKHPALLSRREKVEELCLKSRRQASVKARSRSRAAVDDCPTPGSVDSGTSPEQPCTPLSEEGAQPRMRMCTETRPSPSSIPPSLSYPVSSPPAPGDDYTYVSSAAMASMPSLSARQSIPLKRSFSYPEGANYSFSDFFVFDDTLTESDDQSIRSLDSYAYDPSPTYFGGMSPEQPSPSEFASAITESLSMRPPETSSVPQQATSTSFIPPSNGPLFERRRRAATTSMIPSPLTVVTSSLAGWARDDLATARLIPRVDIAYGAPSQVFQTQTNATIVPHAPHPVIYPEVNVANSVCNPMLQPVISNVNAGMNMLSISIPEPGMDITPRAPAFPQNVQSTYDPSPLMVPTYDYTIPIPEPTSLSPVPYGADPLDLVRDLDYESYRSGLRQYGIGTPMEPYDTPPLDAVDFSAFYGGNVPSPQNC